MFTGIVQKVATVISLQRRGKSSVIGLNLDELASRVEVGDSVMINGVCLTATAVSDAETTFDVSSETLKLTNLGDLHPGEKVNVELAMRPDDRFGGHFVSGHVDATGDILDMADRPGETRLRVRVAEELTDQMIMKGSVAVDGISLTIADLRSETFEVSLIPQTLRETNLRSKSRGDLVNIECDMIGKWIQRHLRRIQDSDEDTLTMDKLREAGL
ncbi:MAG: riboflavin synthase [Planctomycetota bacterium]